MRIATIGELKKIFEFLNDNDCLVIETIDEDGETGDLYPMYIDIIGGIKLEDGTEINEVRFCQMPQTEFNKY